MTENFGEDKGQLVDRLTLGTEQALSRAGILNTAELSVVQAFTIYLETVVKPEGARSIWTLAGLLLRTALSMGLHRDGAHFLNVSPFEAEMRRRVWWHICFLDARVGDCQVFEMGISPGMFDTREPANIDDADMLPTMSELPPTKDAFTDATLCIMRCELWRISRRIRTSIGRRRIGVTQSSLAETERIINETSARIVVAFYKHLDPKEPLHLFQRTLICLDFVSWGVVDYVLRSGIGPQSSPVARDEREQQQSQEGAGREEGSVSEEDRRREARGREAKERDRIFLCATACLDHLFQLRTQPSTRRWAWTLRDHAQWHSLTVIFSQLRVRPWGPMCERAWRLAQHALADAAVGTVRVALLDLAGFVARRRTSELTRLGLDTVPSSGPAAELARLGPPVLPQMHGYDADRRIGFDTEAAEERLALETALVSSVGMHATGTTYAHDHGRTAEDGTSAEDDMWADLELSCDLEIDVGGPVHDAIAPSARGATTSGASALSALVQTDAGYNLEVGFSSFQPDTWVTMQGGGAGNEAVDGGEAAELDRLAWIESFGS